MSRARTAWLPPTTRTRGARVRHRGDDEPLLALGPTDDPPWVYCLRGVLRRRRAPSHPAAARARCSAAAARSRRGACLTGEITRAGVERVRDQPSRTSEATSIDVATSRKPVTFFGENIGDANGVWLLGSGTGRSCTTDVGRTAPRPDPTLTPDEDVTAAVFGPRHRLRAHERRNRGAGGQRSTRAPVSCCAGSRIRGGCRRRCSAAPGTADGATRSTSCFGPRRIVAVPGKPPRVLRHKPRRRHVTISRCGRVEHQQARVRNVRDAASRASRTAAVDGDASPAAAVRRRRACDALVRPFDHGASDARDLGAVVDWKFRPGAVDQSAFSRSEAADEPRDARQCQRSGASASACRFPPCARAARWRPGRTTAPAGAHRAVLRSISP